MWPDEGELLVLIEDAITGAAPSLYARRIVEEDIWVTTQDGRTYAVTVTDITDAIDG